jgi:hypothetical protein
MAETFLDRLTALVNHPAILLLTSFLALAYILAIAAWGEAGITKWKKSPKPEINHESFRYPRQQP